jgi:large subunit ribosomal protein L25
MQHPKLTAEIREKLGKKVNQLRAEGKMPANVYGKHIDSRAVQVSYADFLPMYKELGETGIIDLVVGGQAVPVLIKNPQVNYKSSTPFHVDFFQVNLKEKIKTFVPVKLVGEPLAVTEKLGLLMQVLNEIEIEALPEALPEAIEADTTTLAEVGEMLEVSDLTAPEGVTIVTEGDQVVAQISDLVQVEKEPEPVAAEPVEGEEGAVAEGETPAEGEAATEEGTPEEAPKEKAE